MFNRRRFLYTAGAGALGLIGKPLAPLRNYFQAHAGDLPDADFDPDLEFVLSAEPAEIGLLAGRATSVWSYKGTIIKGEPASLAHLPDSYLGPIIRAEKGQKVRIHFKNNIPAESIIHWHGLHVPAEMDGHPRFAVPRGGEYTYEFTVHNRAGTYWYHPHPHGKTGHQVYGGLAGMFLVSDKEEQALDLPSGEHEIPMVLQDRTFDRDNQLVYLPGGMMNRMTGMVGDTILVNGSTHNALSVATRIYRLRILNGSNSRIYRLAWKDGLPLVVIGTDGGLLEKPLSRPDLMLGPGERVDLWADFSGRKVGSKAELVSLAFDAGAAGMMGRGMMGSRDRLPNGASFKIIQMNITRRDIETRRLPSTLSRIDWYRADDSVNGARPRQFFLEMSHMQGTINRRTFQMEAVANDETVSLDTQETWEFVNEQTGGGMMGMMAMPHPMHLHGMQFQVIKRRNAAHNSYVDQGWKDTVLLMPGERVTILVRFQDYSGLFLYHCHNLEHEDMGMMRNYLVKAAPAKGSVAAV